jgi:hypothetical protein
MIPPGWMLRHVVVLDPLLLRIYCAVDSGLRPLLVSLTSGTGLGGRSSWVCGGGFVWGCGGERTILVDCEGRTAEKAKRGFSSARFLGLDN